MHQEHRLWHQAQQDSSLVPASSTCAFHYFLRTPTRHTSQLWPQVRKRQLETMKMNHLPLTPEPCHSPGCSQGWDRNNRAGRNYANGTVRKSCWHVLGAVGWMCPFSRRRLRGEATEQPPFQFGEAVNIPPLEGLQVLVDGRQARFALPQHLSSTSSEEFHCSKQGG